jgi:hypothetical protein
MPKLWPPPDNLHRVIAKIDDCWIEVNKPPTVKIYERHKMMVSVEIGERPSTWADYFTPITLAFHGCGCCAGTDEPPTHWIEIPTGDENE